MTTIQEGAFRNCTRLASVTIPNSVTTIASTAFLGCRNIREILLKKDSAADSIMRQQYPELAQYIRYMG